MPGISGRAVISVLFQIGFAVVNLQTVKSRPLSYAYGSAPLLSLLLFLLLSLLPRNSVAQTGATDPTVSGYVTSVFQPRLTSM